MLRPEPFIRIRALHYAYRRDAVSRVLDGIDLDIRSGEYLLLCGASGSGKSTLLRALNGLIPHFYGGRLEGSVRIDGTETSRLAVADLLDRVGMVFQNPEAQLFNRTVEREIAFGLESLGLCREEIRRRIDETAACLGIAPLLQRDPHRLSGGEQQLVCLAAVMALNPRIIALDEPYANLDPTGVHRVRRAIRRLRAAGTGVVVGEHRLTQTVPDADRMVLLAGGRVAADGEPSDILLRDVEAWGLSPPGEDPGHIARWKATDRAFSGTGQAILSLEKACLERDGSTILKDIGFRLHRGECLAVVGGNGTGKTSLLKLLNGLYRPSSGRILFAGQDVRRWKVSRLARHVGMAFQNPSGQFFKLTVAEEISVGPRALGCFDEDRIKDLAGFFGLVPLMDRPPYRLSGGEKKRVAFAAALAADPDILVLDEPTSGQDGRFKRALGEFLTGLQRRGKSVVFVTHDLAFAARHALRWLVLSGGRIVADGPAHAILADGDLLRRARLLPPLSEDSHEP